MTISIYQFDPTGTASSNLVTSEQRVIVADNHLGDYFIIPAFAPFFAVGLVITRSQGGIITSLTEGLDYFLGLPFTEASRTLGVPIYGAISFIDRNNSGIAILSYQTVGGDWAQHSESVRASVVLNSYNPRVVEWEKPASNYGTFPPVELVWNILNQVDGTAITDSLDRIKNAMVTAQSNKYSAHLSNHSNPHYVTKKQVGLGHVQNYPVATLTEALAGVMVNRTITPVILKSVIDYRPLVVTAAPTSAPTAAPTPGPTSAPTPAPTPAPIAAGTIITQYCSGYNLIGQYADGNYGTYTSVIQYNSASCGYVPPVAYGTLLGTYCDGYTLIGQYANGSYGIYASVISINNSNCGYVAPVPQFVQFAVNPTTGVVGAPMTIYVSAVGLLPNHNYNGAIEYEYGTYLVGHLHELTGTHTTTSNGNLAFTIDSFVHNLYLTTTLFIVLTDADMYTDAQLTAGGTFTVAIYPPARVSYDIIDYSNNAYSGGYDSTFGG